MKKCNAVFLSIALFVLAGCAATSVAPPAESPLSGEPFVISVPKDLNRLTNSKLKGVTLGSFKNISGKSPVHHFFSVRFSESGDELTTEICRGNFHDNGSTFKSCVYYDAHISVFEDNLSFKISLTPYRERIAQGRDEFFIPIGLPEVNLNKWYGWLSNQTVVTSHKATSQYRPESIKGNFDRKLQLYSFHSQADAALKQFKDSYTMYLDSKKMAIVGTSIYPYKDGTIVDMYIVGRADTVSGLTSRDWITALSSVKSKLDEVVRD
jgi:hypothetical protein